MKCTIERQLHGLFAPAATMTMGNGYGGFYGSGTEERTDGFASEAMPTIAPE